MGLAREALQASLRYTQERVQFDRPLRDHPLVQSRIAGMFTRTHAARLLCVEASRQRDQGACGAIGATMTAKYEAARAAVHVAGEALQLHGANGFGAALSVQRLFRDAQVFELIEGSTPILQMLIAEHAYQHGGEIE